MSLLRKVAIKLREFQLLCLLCTNLLVPTHGVESTVQSQCFVNGCHAPARHNTDIRAVCTLPITYVQKA